MTSELSKWEEELNQGLKLLEELNEIALSLFRKKIHLIGKANKMILEDQAVILMNYRRIIEISTGLSALLDQRMGGTSESLLRDLIESYTHFTFILEKKSEVKERALAYYYQDLINGIYQMQHLQRQYRKDVDFVNEFKEKEKQLNKSIKSERLKVTRELWENYKENNKVYDKRTKSYKKYDPHYFSLYLPHVRSLNQFVSAYKPSEIDRKLYSDLSRQVHGLNAHRDIGILVGYGRITHLNYIKEQSPVVASSILYMEQAIRKFSSHYELDEEIVKERIRRVLE